MKLTQLALCLVAATTTATTLPVAAQSMSPQDYPFLTGVNGKLDKGLYVSDQQKMSDGHAVCQQLNTGKTLGQVNEQRVQSLAGQTFTLQYPMTRYYRAVQEYAIRNYCPGFSNQLGWIYGTI